MNNFTHNHLQFKYPKSWMDKSRLMLFINPTSTVQIIEEKFNELPFETFHSQYIERVTSELSTVNARLVVTREREFANCSAKETIFEISDPRAGSLLQLHCVIDSGLDSCVIFVGTFAKNNQHSIIPVLEEVFSSLSFQRNVASLPVEHTS